MTNSNEIDEIKHGKIATVNFHPMPKRFKVWDNVGKQWLLAGVTVNTENISKVVNGAPQHMYEIIQSTNLFDKDGEEIFEGAVIEDEDKDRGHIAYDIEEGQLQIIWENEEYYRYGLTSPIARQIKVIGHILSDPELLKEKVC